MRYVRADRNAATISPRWLEPCSDDEPSPPPACRIVRSSGVTDEPFNGGPPVRVVAREEARDAILDHRQVGSDGGRDRRYPKGHVLHELEVELVWRPAGGGHGQQPDVQRAQIVDLALGAPGRLVVGDVGKSEVAPADEQQSHVRARFQTFSGWRIICRFAAVLGLPLRPTHTVPSSPPMLGDPPGSGRHRRRSGSARHARCAGARKARDSASSAITTLLMPHSVFTFPGALR